MRPTHVSSECQLWLTWWFCCCFWRSGELLPEFACLFVSRSGTNPFQGVFHVMPLCFPCVVNAQPGFAHWSCQKEPWTATRHTKRAEVNMLHHLCQEFLVLRSHCGLLARKVEHFSCFYSFTYLFLDARDSERQLSDSCATPVLLPQVAKSTFQAERSETNHPKGKIGQIRHERPLTAALRSKWFDNAFLVQVFTQKRGETELKHAVLAIECSFFDCFLWFLLFLVCFYLFVQIAFRFCR